MVCCALIAMLLGLGFAIVKPFGFQKTAPLAWRPGGHVHGPVQSPNRVSALTDRIHSFRYAVNGITHAVKTEAHLRIHFAFAGAALFLGWVLAASPTQWVGLLFAIGLVMSAELLNSAIEGLCDVVSPSYDARIGKVKDMAAGGVLICAVTAMAIGLIIFIPLIIEKIP